MAAQIYISLITYTKIKQNTLRLDEQPKHLSVNKPPCGEPTVTFSEAGRAGLGIFCFFFGLPKTRNTVRFLRLFKIYGKLFYTLAFVSIDVKVHFKSYFKSIRYCDGK